MTNRQHLIIDALGQALIIIFYSLLTGNSSSPIEILKIMPVVLFSWQIINAILSYKFFERQSKKIFVRTGGWTIAGIFLFWGATWVLFQFPILPVLEIIEKSEFIFWVLIPFLSAAFCCWYLYLTFKEVYNMLFNTI